MKKQDEYYYTIKDNLFIAYYKNGNLHREIGPAVYHIEEKDKYFNLADKDLYKENAEITSKSLIVIYMLVHANSTPEELTSFFLNDNEITSKEFYADLTHKELQQELVTNKTLSKKLKV